MTNFEVSLFEGPHPHPPQKKKEEKDKKKNKKEQLVGRKKSVFAFD